MKRALVLSPLLALAAGCNLYFGNHHQVNDDVECGFGDDIASTSTRDPSTGNCQFDPQPCPDDCPCPAEDLGAPILAGPSCDGACEGLDESSCLATSGCHAEYLDVSDGTNSFIGFGACWDIQPLPIVEGGGCSGLDAFTCAEHDDCSTLIKQDADGNVFFSQCQDEQPGGDVCAGVDCGAGQHCESECFPCDPPAGDDAYGCDNTCEPVCVADPPPPNDPGTCDGEVWCDVAALPACPDGTTPGIANGCYTGYCIPLADCDPKDPGTCDGAVCNLAPPACPDGTVPGVKDGCWSGYCIPTASCPQPL